MSEITIILQEKLGSKNTLIKVKPDTKFSELIKIYYKKEFIPIKIRDKLKYVFMNKEISSSSEKSLIDLGIKDFSKIQIELVEKVKLSFSALNVVRIKEKEKLEKLKQEILENEKKMRQKNEEIHGEIEKEKQTNNKINRTLEDMCIYGNIIKQEIKEEKQNNPENIVKTEEALNKRETDEEIFVLGLLSKNLEERGIETIIEKKENNSDKNKDKENNIEEDSTCLQFLASGLFGKNRYDLHFDFGEKRNEQLLNEENEFEKFKKQLILKLSKDYNVPQEKIIVTFPQKGSLKVQVIFQSDEFNDLDLEDFKSKFRNDEEFEELNNLKEIHKDVIMGACRLRKTMLDPRGNRKDGWGVNEKRGNKPYIPPIGWIGIGLKVMDKYENNTWIGMSNCPGEWCVAYHGVCHGQPSDQVKRITGLIYKGEERIEPGFRPGNAQGHASCNDECHPGQLVGRGVYCTPNIAEAENYAGISNINGNNYKTVLMVRVKPEAIRHCSHVNSEYWVVNGLTDEIRPYRILYKKTS